ncbi:MAG: ion channel DMI1 [Candidatus Krumholzibacteriia bacterium]
MLHRLRDLLVFRLERFVIAGSFNQLVLVAMVLLLVSLAAGAIVFLALPRFDDLGESIWWGFLRLSDPGYLGDDEGTVARTVSLIVTVLGYVLFMGALVAILNQGLGRLMRRLEAGATPISMSGHVLILGWTNRTTSILRELLVSGSRVRRFLHRARARRLRIVVLAGEVTGVLVHDAKEELAGLWDDRTIVLRSGDPLRPEHLARTDFLRAAAIVLPTGDFARAGAEALDARTIKTVMLIDDAVRRAGLAQAPPITAELFDERKRPLLAAAYSGDIAIVPGAMFLSQLIAQNLRHSGLSHVYRELLSYGEGNEIYVREAPELTGEAVGAAAGRFPHAVLLGFLRPEGEQLTPYLNPPADMTLAGGDRLVFVAENFERTAPDGKSSLDVLPASVESPREPPVHRRILALGWSRKLPALLAELETYAGERYTVDVVSLIPQVERQAFMRRFASRGAERVQVHHLDADFTSPSDLAAVNPQGYDNVILFASDLKKTDEEADARSILGYLVLVEGLQGSERPPDVLVELLDEDNAVALAGRPAEVIVTPTIVSHMLAHVTLRRDLLLIFEELFTAGGAEIFFRAPDIYGLAGEERSFRELEEAVRRRGEILVGMKTGAARAADSALLNPPKDSRWRPSAADRLIVVGTGR